MNDNRERNILKNPGRWHVDWGCVREHLKAVVFQTFSDMGAYTKPPVISLRFGAPLRRIASPRKVIS